MKAYKITATATDGNGVIISSNTAETLGEACGATYLTRERAEEVRDDMASDLPEGYETSKYDIEEIDIEALEDGKRYDVESVRAVAQPLPAGHNIGDYFRAGRYLGADDNGVGVRI